MTGPAYPSDPNQPGGGQYPQPGGGQYQPAPPGGYPAYPGYPAQPPPGYAPPQQYMQPWGYGAPGYGMVQQQGNGLAVAALVLGIVSLVFCWVPYFDWVLAALAIIFGAVGVSTANRRMGAGKGMAVAGLVLGIVTVLLGVIFFALIWAAVHSITCSNGVCS